MSMRDWLRESIYVSICDWFSYCICVWLTHMNRTPNPSAPLELESQKFNFRELSPSLSPPFSSLYISQHTGELKGRGDDQWWGAFSSSWFLFPHYYSLCFHRLQTALVSGCLAPRAASIWPERSTGSIRPSTTSPQLLRVLLSQSHFKFMIFAIIAHLWVWVWLMQLQDHRQFKQRYYEFLDYHQKKDGPIFLKICGESACPGIANDYLSVSSVLISMFP